MWDLSYLRQLNPTDFENLVSHLFQAMGYRTRLTPVSKDGGVDIEASIDHVGLSHVWLIQAKRYSGNVGVKEVREYCSLKYREHVDGVIIVTTSGFTREAHEEAAKHNVKLIEGSLLVTMLDHYCPEQYPDSKQSAPETEISVNGETVIGRHHVMFEGSKVNLTLTPEHIFLEKQSTSLFSRKPELLKRLKVKDIVGFHQEANDIILVFGGSSFEIMKFTPLKLQAFISMLESLRPSYLRGETLMKLESSGREFVILTSRRFEVIGKKNELLLSINLKDIAGCEGGSAGAFRRKKLVILESKDGIIRHEVEVKDAGDWLNSVRNAIQGY
nr:restriction endonuclease [Methanohalophilus levihalophilus]